MSSANLMASSGVIAAFGFVFWVTVARTFNFETVGLATTLLSVSVLISLLGMAGFDTVFVRFLAHSNQRNEFINSGLIISGIVTAIIAVGFCLIAPFVSPRIGFVGNNPLTVLTFVVFTVFGTWSVLTDAVLIAYRRSTFIVTINIIFSAVKMISPFIITHGGPMVIFAFAGVAQVVNVILSIIALIKYYDYKPSLKISLDVLKKTRNYGSAVYAAHLLNLLPDSILPIIVVNKLGPQAAAFFYIAFTVANLIYTIAFATTQALLAEASHDETRLWEHFRKALRITTALLIPVSIIVIIICPFVLTFFGHQYSGGATGLLRILSLSGLIVMLYSALGTLFKLTHNLRAILIMNAVNAVSIIGLAVILVKPFGLNGIGWSWLIGNIVSVFVGGFYGLRTLRTKRF